MPHSGGGGSHGGGSHGGSRGGSSGSSNRVSQTYFSGAHRYMYYYNGRPNYYYANRKVMTNWKATGLAQIVFSVFWLLMCLPLGIGIFSTVFNTGPLSLNYDYSIVIDDEIGIVDNVSELTEAFKEFREKTGVTLSVVTRYPENTYMGDTYERQAYNCYVSRWDDEKHWLIYYVGETTDREDDWHWELMCGDDCKRVLSSSVEDKFTKDFHRYLVARDRYTFNEAVLAALGNIDVNPGAVDIASLAACIPFLIFPVLGIVLLISGIKTVNKPLTQEEQAKNNAMEIMVEEVCQETACEYCGGVYVLHTCLQCPHCGAPVKIENSVPQNPGYPMN